VVLARSYTQEEYYTCIYCGWQAFKPFEEANADSPLAARLLAQRPPQPAEKEKGGDEEGRKSKSVIRDDDEGDSQWSRSVMGDENGRGPAVRPDDGDEEAPRKPAVVAEEAVEEDDADAGEDEDFDLGTGADDEE